MRNKLLLTLCVVLAFAFVLGACDGVTNGEIEYGFDQEYHWVKSDGETLKQPHVFDKGVQTKPAEGDDCGEMTYTCTVCNYKKVTRGHATESFWSSDEAEHWKNATCGHNVKVDSGKHSYSPSGICLICGRFSTLCWARCKAKMRRKLRQSRSFSVALSARLQPTTAMCT